MWSVTGSGGEKKKVYINTIKISKHSGLHIYTIATPFFASLFGSHLLFHTLSTSTSLERDWAIPRKSYSAAFTGAQTRLDPTSFITNIVLPNASWHRTIFTNVCTSFIMLFWWTLWEELAIHFLFYLVVGFTLTCSFSVIVRRYLRRHCACVLSGSVVSDSLWPYGLQEPSRLRRWTRISCVTFTASRFFTHWTIREAQRDTSLQSKPKQTPLISKMLFETY